MYRKKGIQGFDILSSSVTHGNYAVMVFGYCSMANIVSHCELRSLTGPVIT